MLKKKKDVPTLYFSITFVISAPLMSMFHHHQVSSDQHLLSCATALATSQLFHPALSRSFSIVPLQVIFWLFLSSSDLQESILML